MLCRNRLAACGRRSAAAGSRVLGTPPAPRRSADGSTAASGRGRATLEQGVGRGVRCTARRLIAKRPPLDLSFIDDAEAKAFAAITGGRSLATYHVRPNDAGAVSQLPGFGEAAGGSRTSPPRCRRVDSSERRRCSRPMCRAWGKTMQLAGAGHRVTAVDQSGVAAETPARESRTHRARRSARDGGRAGSLANLRRHPARCALLGDGHLRRHPEVLYRACPAIIRDSAELQRPLLDRAAAWLKPRRTLVYSVCSLEREEGEAIIAAFLDANPVFAIDFELVSCLTS